MKSTLKFAALSVFGILLSFVLFSLFVEIDVRILSISAANEEMFSRAAKSAWRFNWIFNPVNVFIVALVVSALYKGKFPMLIGVVVVSVSPLVLVLLVASPLDLFSFGLTGLYIAIAIVVASLISRTKK